MKRNCIERANSIFKILKGAPTARMCLAARLCIPLDNNAAVTDNHYHGIVEGGLFVILNNVSDNDYVNSSDRTMLHERFRNIQRFLAAWL